jgi:hypothetical protein
VIGLPPVDAGGVHVIDALPFPATAVTPVGAPGTPIGVTSTGLDAGPVPTTFLAATVIA